MPRNPCTFSKSDVRRAILAASDAGLFVARVEFRPDVIMLHTERKTAALAGAAGLADRPGGRRGKSLRRPETIQTVSAP
jgi:hypothetical protein